MGTPTDNVRERFSASARAKLDQLAKEETEKEQAAKVRQRARFRRRKEELHWVQACHPGLRVRPEQPKLRLPAGSLPDYAIADYAVFDKGGRLKAIYEFGSLSFPNKFQLWAAHFPEAAIYWVPMVLCGDSSMPFAAIKYR